MKKCSKCKNLKDLSEFSRRKYQSGNWGYQAYCKSCNKIHKTKWLPDNRNRVRWNIIWSKYRLRQEDWQKMYSEQNGLCKICEIKEASAVDHDHNCCPGANSCGKCVRSLLCGRCNALLAFVENTPDVLDRLQKYIKPD